MSKIVFDVTHVPFEASVVDDCADETPINVIQFRRIVNQMQTTYEKKNADYGDSFGKSVENYGFIAALTRMSDKFNRIENLILGAKNKVPDESLEDTLLDLACYSVMTLMQLRNKSANRYEEN